jgi:hypothetical protein
MRFLAAEVERYFYQRSGAVVFVDVTKKSADRLGRAGR